MRDPHGAASGEAIVLLAKSLPGSDGNRRIVCPVIAVQALVAEVEESTAVKVIGAALRLHGDDATCIAAFVGAENTAFHAELADRVWRGNRAVGGVELRLLHRVAVYADTCAVHLAAGNRIAVSH